MVRVSYNNIYVNGCFAKRIYSVVSYTSRTRCFAKSARVNAPAVHINSMYNAVASGVERLAQSGGKLLRARVLAGAAATARPGRETRSTGPFPPRAVVVDPRTARDTSAAPAA